MPELPEVEVTRRGLQDRLRDATVRGLRLGKPLRAPLGCDPAGLIGLRVGHLGRRGKYLWMPLADPVDAGAGGGLLWHLGMSGSMRWGDPAELGAPGPHDHFDLVTDRGVLRLEVRNLDPMVTVRGELGALEFGSTRLDELARWWVGEPHRFTDGWAARQVLAPR